MEDFKTLIFLFTWILTAQCQRKLGDECQEQYTGSTGICTLVKDCESAKKAAEGNGIQPTFCAYSAFSPTLVCCLDKSNILNVGGPKKEERPIWNSGNGSKRLSERKCEEYSQSVIHKTGYGGEQTTGEQYIKGAKCDLSTKLIIGGEKAYVGEFPHMVAIGWANNLGGYNFPCGGSLISPKFVLTAGHCIKYEQLDPDIARLGDYNIDPTVKDGADPVDVPIRKVIKHPNYDPPMTYNDIALMELATAVKFTKFIRPACLWSQPGFGRHTEALATGWGLIEYQTDKTSKDLLKVALSLQENNRCDALLKNFRSERKWNGFVPSQLCAGELKGGKDTCQGDSGGPLQVYADNNPCIFYLMGVVSFGRHCAVQGQPGVYTRVSSFVDWIEKNVWPGE